MSQIPNIKPIKVQQFETKQSRYKQVPRLPARSILLAPSGGGKGILLQNLIMDIYKGCFSKVFIFSPSIFVDKTWSPVLKYLEDTIGFHSEEDKYLFDHYNSEDLEKIIEDQKKIATHQKNNNHKKLHQICIIVDDFADQPSFSRHSKLLHGLFTKGRHSFISSFVSTQKASALSTIIRVNCTEWYIWKLRSFQDLQMILEELGALQPKQTLLEIYKKATEEPYSFLYVNLRATDPNDIFNIKFDKKIEIEDVD